MLTLEATMLTTFGGGESEVFRPLMLSLTGVAVIGFAITTSVIMIVKGNKKLKAIKDGTLQVPEVAADAK